MQEAVKDRSGFELGMGKMIELCEHCDDDVCDRCCGRVMGGVLFEVIY